MTARDRDNDDSDDFFAHTRMSLGDHIEELRTALFSAIKGFVVALILGFCLAQPATHFIARPVERELAYFYKARVDAKNKELEEQTRYTLTDQSLASAGAAGLPADVADKLAPLKDQQWARAELVDKLNPILDKENRDVYENHILDNAVKSGSGPAYLDNVPKPLRVTINRRTLARAVGVDPDKFPDDEAVALTFLVSPDKVVGLVGGQIRDLIRPPTLSALSVTEAFMVWLQVAIYIGFVLASPWIFFQLWMFVAAGLYPTEKRLVHVYLPFSLALFLVGVLVCEFVVMPIGIHYLLSFNQWMNIEPDLRLSEWLTFAILMPLVFGIAFQLPLVMFFLDRIGLLTVKTYLAYWRMAVFVILLLSAVLAVSPDPFSALAMAIPLWGLYFLGIWLCWVMPRAEPDLEVPDPEEMVEV